MATMTDPATHYLDEARRQLRGHKRMGESALSQLRDEDFFVTLDPESNSVAILVKHVAGNLRSRFTDFLTSDGEKADRNRDQEFILDENASRGEILGLWEQHWKLALDTIQSLKPEDLDRTVTIRAQPHSVLQALQRAAGHLAYHTGQIVF